jgi:tetratricopeptide (TPR) repeat protein
MNKLSFLIVAVAASLAVAFSPVCAQTFPGCSEQDYNCQLKAAMKALEADPKNAENYYNVASVLQRSGAHKQAIETYSMYISIPGVKPNGLADGYNNRGVSYRRMGQPGPALADFVKASELVPTSPAFVANQGNANTDLKKYDAALANYAAALKLDPRFAQAYSGRAHLHNILSRPDEAIADFSKAIEYDPNDPENYYNRAIVYRDRHEHAKSIADFDKYIPLVAGDNVYQADGYINRGIAYAALGRREQALTDFTKVIELDPRRANGYRARAMIYREMKKGDLAAADEKKAAELSP